MRKKLFSIIAAASIFLSSSQLAFAADVKSADQHNLKNLSQGTDLYQKNVAKNKKLIEGVKSDNDFKVISDDGNGNASFTNNPNSKKSKEELFQKLSDFSAQDTVTGDVSANNHLNYSNGAVYVNFDDTDTVSNSLTTDCQYNISGDSSSDWSGSNPYYASSIDQADQFVCYVNSGYLTIGWPPSLQPAPNTTGNSLD